jgi:hypothetical protein
MWVIDIPLIPILLCILLVLGTYKVIKPYRKHRKAIQAEKKRRLSLPAADPWEKDFVESLRSAHHVLRIETATVTFLGKADTARDGFRWICKCGAHDSSLTLEAAGRNYQRHLTLEADKAAAQLGKFELPAGISWDTKVFERKE